MDRYHEKGDRELLRWGIVISVTYAIFNNSLTIYMTKTH